MSSLSRPQLSGLWSQVTQQLKSRLSREDFETWIAPLKPLASNGDSLELSVPNRLVAAWIRDHFVQELSAAWTAAAGSQIQFQFTLPDDASRQGELFPPPDVESPDTTQPSLFDQPASPERTLQKPRRSGSGGLIPRYDFASFVVGTNNQFARAAALAVSGRPGALYNPFFVFGGVGLGKTHLVNAIGNAIVEHDPAQRVQFISADMFTNRLIDAIARDRVREFKQRMRRIDVLIIDDVQFLAGRERTQEEFFHLFNALYDDGRQIILTSDKFPSEIHGLEERLCNRFSWGLVADIQPPDIETRVAIIERKARDEGITLPIDVASFIATRIDSNVRDLEGALTKLSAWASIHRQEITLDLARELLGSGNEEETHTPTPEEIEARVTRHFGLRPGELKARRRTRKVAEARHVAMYMMRHYGGMSFPTIGEYLGGRDHSTVVHGCQAVERRCRDDRTFRSMLATLARMIECG